ncbi:MAG: hypothetical protein N3A38_13630 [Planctomycetota bacterium]|nr:hypothetical protein [Planctomycetota bacterium]
MAGLTSPRATAAAAVWTTMGWISARTTAAAAAMAVEAALAAAAGWAVPAGAGEEKDDLPPRKEIKAALDGRVPLDLARLCLLLAKEDFPELDVEREIKRIDALADEFREYMVPDASDEYLCRRFRRFMFLEKLRCRPAGSNAGPASLYPHAILNRGEGFCLGLSVIGISVARRLKLPIYGATVPGHFYLKYVGRENTEMIETTEKGTRFDEEAWLKETGRDRKSAEAAGYLTPLTDRQVFAAVLYNLNQWRLSRGDPKRALEYAEMAAGLEPRSAEYRTARGEALLRLNDADGAKADADAAIELDPLLRAPRRLKKYIERTEFLRVGGTAEKPAADWLEYQAIVADLLAGRADETLPRLEALARKYPREPEPHYALAVAHGQKGDADRCIESLRRAVSFGFNDPPLLIETPDFALVKGRDGWRELMEMLDLRTDAKGGAPTRPK